ncbi:PGF-pre-PGF domain-containing protein [Methanolobus halotolerans]|nr:PGF-pre-PGF domain-containing protein [Methanolobus halotolerans]
MLSILNPVSIVSAASDPTASVSPESPLSMYVGDTSDISISIGNCSNCSNVTSLNLTLSFNHSILEFIGANTSNNVTGNISNIIYNDSVYIELNDMDELNATNLTPVIDISFKANKSGNTSIYFNNTQLTANSVSYPISSLDYKIEIIDNMNRAPEFVDVPPQTIKQNKNLQFLINATDPDEDDLNYSVISELPEGSTFDNSARLFNWTPSTDQEGPYYVNFSVSDGKCYVYMEVPITVEEASTDDEKTASSGGGGGGSQTTGEAYENIEFKDYALKPVVKDIETVFSFGIEDNSIISVSFTTALNGGQTKTVVEILKGTSTLVSGAAPGNVYKNMNIWVGDGKFLPELMSDAKVVFKVEKSWIDANDVDPDSIKLLRYSGNAWEQLPTSLTGGNDVYYYYVTRTPGFSPFAIASVEEGITNVEASEGETESVQGDDDVKNSVDDMVTPENNIATQNERSTGTTVLILVLLGVVFIGLLGYNKREYCEQCYGNLRAQFGNPDGKRYRRSKK